MTRNRIRFVIALLAAAAIRLGAARGANRAATHLCALSRQRHLRRRRNRRLDRDAGPVDTQVQLQVDHPPQQRRRSQGRQARSLLRLRQDRNHRRSARDDLRRGRAVRRSSCRPHAAPRAAAAPRRRYIGGNTGRNNGLYAVGAAVAPQKLGLSTPRPADFDAFWDGKLAAQRRSRSTPNSRRSKPTCPALS